MTRRNSPKPVQSNWQAAWKQADGNITAHREQLAGDGLMNTCWACHARRSTLVEGSLPGLPLEDSHRPALLTQPTYYADGQQRDEDYTWGSFRQSKMFRNGVTCMDCHEPHLLKLRGEGQCTMYALPQCRKIRYRAASFPQTGFQGRTVHGLSCAWAKLYGD